MGTSTMPNVLPKMLEVLEQRIPRGVKSLRFGVIHVGCAECVDRARIALQEKYGDREIITASATPVIATHIGPGAWGICWQLED